MLGCSVPCGRRCHTVATLSIISAHSIEQHSCGASCYPATRLLLSAIIYVLVPGHTSRQPGPPTPSDLVLYDSGPQGCCAVDATLLSCGCNAVELHAPPSSARPTLLYSSVLRYRDGAPLHAT